MDKLFKFHEARLNAYTYPLIKSNNCKMKNCFILVTCIIINNIGFAQKTNFENLVFENFEENGLLNKFNITQYYENGFPANSIKKYDVNIDFASRSTIISKEDSLFNFLCKQDVINRWYLYKNKSDSVIFSETIHTRDEARLKKIELYKQKTTKIQLLGNVRISSRFRSLLIQIDIDQRNKKLDGLYISYLMKDLYLLNFSGNNLISIVKLSTYYSDTDCVIHWITRKFKKSNYIFEDKNNGINKVKFSIDNNGYIVLATCHLSAKSKRIACPQLPHGVL